MLISLLIEKVAVLSSSSLKQYKYSTYSAVWNFLQAAFFMPLHSCSSFDGRLIFVKGGFHLKTEIIAIANQKGGVGKTTTCANLGIGLAQAGKKVLLIDGDPQGSLTISLGNPQPDKLPFTLSDAMSRILTDEPIKPGEGILHHPEGVDLMPADIQLSGMEVSLVNAMSRETILRQYLDTVKGQYSHILIWMLGKVQDLKYAIQEKVYG